MAEVGVVTIDLIRLDGGTQLREQLDDYVVQEYGDKLVNGTDLGPLDVFYDGEAHWLADGFHRIAAAKLAKLASIEARIHRGTLRDAIFFAVRANSAHGLRRSNADKRKAVQAMLDDDEWCRWSDRRIAEHAAVSVDLVGAVRKQLSETDSSSPVARASDQPRLGMDGKLRQHPRRDDLNRDAGISEPARPLNTTVGGVDEELDRLFSAAIDHIHRAVTILDTLCFVTGDEHYRESIQNSLQVAADDLRAWRKGKRMSNDTPF